MGRPSEAPGWAGVAILTLNEFHTYFHISSWDNVRNPARPLFLVHASLDPHSAWGHGTGSRSGTCWVSSSTQNSPETSPQTQSNSPWILGYYRIIFMLVPVCISSSVHYLLILNSFLFKSGKKITSRTASLKTVPWPMFFERQTPARTTSLLIRSSNSPKKSFVDGKLAPCLEGIRKCQFLPRGIGFGSIMSSEDQRGRERGPGVNTH